MGVNDHEAFPSLIQASLNDYQVKNFAVPGYGTIHALLQLKNQLNAGQVPQMVLVGYTSVQDARNMLTGIQQKYWTETLASAVHPNLQAAAFPYAQIKRMSSNTERKELIIKYKSINDFDRPWKWSVYSSFIYRIETIWSNIYYGFSDKYKLSEAIVEHIHWLCYKHEIPFFLVGLDKSESLTKMEAFCKSKSIPFYQYRPGHL